MAKTALISGITGQDGSYLAELLLSKGYRVCGMVRRSSNDNLQRIEHIRDRIERNGTIEGKGLLDAFSGPPFGWSPDTTRYLVGALLLVRL